MNMTRFVLPFLLAASIAATSAADTTGKSKAEPGRQADAQPKPAPQGGIALSPDSATIDKIMEQAVHNIAARYNLNEAQKKKTAEIMKREVTRFLQEHEETVWPIIRDLLTHQLGNVTPNDPEVAKRIGKAAGSLMGKVEEAILRGNEEWRMYLSPEQKRMHDYDLAEMDKTFRELNANFEAWAEGKPKDAPLFPPPPAPELSPPRPRMPSDGLPEPEIEVFRATLFETYVEEFIKKYQLDKAQIEAARSILDEFHGKADDFKTSKKDELKKIALDLRRAHETSDRQLLRESEAKRKQVLEPVYVLFNEMTGRLQSLLTTSQIQRFAASDGSGLKPNDNRPNQPDAKTGSDGQPAGSDAATKRPTPVKPKANDAAKDEKKKNDG
jgi:hypothetical protein